LIRSLQTCQSISCESCGKYRRCVSARRWSNMCTMSRLEAVYCAKSGKGHVTELRPGRARVQLYNSWESSAQARPRLVSVHHSRDVDQKTSPECIPLRVHEDIIIAMYTLYDRAGKRGRSFTPIASHACPSGTGHQGIWILSSRVLVFFVKKWKSLLDFATLVELRRAY
jgi:hypothetical protein